MDQSAIRSKFSQILTAAKERRGDLSVDTMIVSSHLAQMRTFMLRRGIEFFAEQDSFGKRREFISRVAEDNMLEMKFESIVDYFLCDGQGLFYFRPVGETYQILYFPRDSYRAYRDQNSELESVVLTYSFNVKQTNALANPLNADGKDGVKKWIQLKVYKDRIEQTISDEKIEFDNTGMGAYRHPGHTEVLTNSLGYIPAIEVFNHMDCTGEATGNGEFDWMAHQILYHDELVHNIRKNIKFFGNPTLVSSRPRHDILESGDESTFRPTISSQAGFSPMGASNSTRVSQPFGTSSIDGSIKVPRVIANLEPTDRVQYMTPDSVSGDQNLYVKQYRSEIRLALGGVDDIDINTAATAYEIKTLYGRVAATAEKKARALFTYGLCRLFGMMIYTEEENFKKSFALAVGLEEPIPPLEEDFEDREMFSAAVEEYNAAFMEFVDLRDQELRARLESGDIPPNVTGLIPDGSNKVNWRWMGEVFEESTDDILNNSIVVRNLQELGVDSIEALKYLFPAKTEEERAAMLSGYPFRMVQQTQSSINSFIGLLGNLYQLPHPQMPDMPLASDPNLDLTGFLYRSLEFLRKELSYSGTYKPSGGDSAPDELSRADKQRAKFGKPIRDIRTPDLPGISGPSTGTFNAGLPGDGPGSAGFGTPGQSMAAGVPGSERKSEFSQPLPGPGYTLGLPDDANPTNNFGTQLGFSGTTGNADFATASFNPGLLGIGSQPAGAASGSTRRSSGSRSVSKRNQQRKS